MLHDPGVTRIQPGIESLNDHILTLMRKGTTALQNIQMLKWCLEFGVHADWNLLYGFPGETREDYDQMMTLLEAIRFFPAPGACGPIRLDRFSPYFSAPSEFGLGNLRPIAPYRYLYPSADGDLSRIAYYFDFEYDCTVDPSGCADDVIAYVDGWRANPGTGSLRAIERPDGSLCLVDTRHGATQRETFLSGMDGEVYRFCDSVQSCRSVARHLTKVYPTRRLDEPQVRGFLDALVSNRLMVRDGDRYLSLALGAPAREPAVSGNALRVVSERRGGPIAV